MHLPDYLRFARRWVPIALAAAIVAAVLTYALSAYALTKVYTSSVTMEVQLGAYGSPGGVDPNLSSAYAQTEAAVANQSPVLIAAFRRATRSTNRAIQARVLNQERPAVTCQTNGLTSLFTCSASAHSPQFAARVANNVAAVFIAQESRRNQIRYQAVLSRIVSEEKTDQTIVAGLQTQYKKSPTTALAGQISANQSRYLNLLQLDANTRATEASGATIVQVVTPAVASFAPSSPRPPLNALVALFLVFALAIGVGVLGETLTDTIRGDDELKEITGLPILGFVPYIPNLRGKVKSPAALVTALQPRSPAAESFRVARANIAFARLDSPVHSLLVTSAVQDEGKSTVAANLAVAFAESGKRTILVDLDLRRPSVATMFSTAHYGLTNLLLQEDSDPGPLLIRTSVPNLSVLPTGPLPPNPAELLTSHRAAEVMHSLKSVADVIIIDSPPLLAVADAAIAAGFADGAILVMRPDKLKRRTLRRVVETLEAAGIKATGIVVNSVPPTGHGYYYGYYTSYSYGGEPSANNNGRSHDVTEEAARESISRK